MELIFAKRYIVCNQDSKGYVGEKCCEPLIYVYESNVLQKAHSKVNMQTMLVLTQLKTLINICCNIESVKLNIFNAFSSLYTYF